MAVKGVTYGKEYGLGFFRGTCFEVTRKTKISGGVRSNQVKRPGYIKCFNVCWKVATNCDIL